MPAGQVRPLASRVPQALRQRTGAPVGVWLGATLLLRRPCPTSEPYPHICGLRVPRRPERIQRGECAAEHATATKTGEVA